MTEIHRALTPGKVSMMLDRFTRRSRTGRGRISKATRLDVYQRDKYSCQYCGGKLTPGDCTIDHLIPLALGGLDETINYVTACRDCNEQKGAQPLDVVASKLKIPISGFPVHGDPVLDNKALHEKIHAIRAHIHDVLRSGAISIVGASAQKKIEKLYRRSFWQSEIGSQLQAELPSLPGHVRVMMPEIETIAETPEERLLLLELAKSAATRNLIGTLLTRGCGVIARVESIAQRTTDDALRRRLNHALARFEKHRHTGDPDAD